MDRIRVFVSLDYHKESVRMCMQDVHGRVLGNRSCSNDVQRVLACADGFGCVQGAAIVARRMGGDRLLTFDNVPDERLYWLVAADSRKLEQIFNIGDGKQI